jgi:hypothetical protein
MWTNSYPTRAQAPDLVFFHPPAVGEKNFWLRAKIRTNGAHPKLHTREM